MEEGEWIPETVFKITNGKTIAEFYAVLKTHKEMKGPHIVLQPLEMRRVTLRELLPEGYDNSFKLGGATITISAFNTSLTDDNNYSVLIEGPFKKPKNQSETISNDETHRIINLHQVALDKRDFDAMRQLINEPIPEQYDDRPDFYACINFARGKMFSHLSKLEDADASFEAGWKDFNDEDRWYYCIIWANALMENILVSKIENEKKESVEKALRILDLATEWIDGTTFQKYYFMCADGMKAYCLCYLNRHDEAKELFKKFEFATLTQGDFTAPTMYTYFEHIAYCLAAAIELKDAELIRNLCKIINIHKPGIMEEKGAWRKMKMTLGSVRQQGRKTIKYSFDNFINNSNNYYPQFPNLQNFLKLMQRNDEAGMEQFFK